MAQDIWHVLGRVMKHMKKKNKDYRAAVAGLRDLFRSVKDGTMAARARERLLEINPNICMNRSIRLCRSVRSIGCYDRF